MGRGAERQVETSLGMRRDMPERPVETSLGMRHAAPEGDGGRGTRYPAESAGRSGAGTQDSPRRPDSGADQRGRHEPPAPQRLSDKTAVEPVDARVAPPVRGDSDGGRRRAPTGTFPPVTPGHRSAEASPADTSGYQPTSRRAADASPADTSGYQPTGRRAADAADESESRSSGRRSADAAATTGRRSAEATGRRSAEAAQAAGHRSTEPTPTTAGRGTAEATPAETSGYQPRPTGRRSAEATPTPAPTGRRAKPEDDEGGRRRRSEGTPAWQDTTTEPAGSHAEGTSVKDLLAAHGGTAGTGRRRRRED